MKRTDRAIMEKFVHLAPLFGEIFQFDMAVGIVDKTMKVISYTPGKTIDFKLEVGGKASERSPLAITVSSGKPFSELVPAHIYGVPFHTTTYPIKNAKGQVIGGLGLAKSIQKEETLNRNFEELIERIIGYNQMIGVVAEETPEMAKSAKQSLDSTQIVSANTENMINSVLTIASVNEKIIKKNDEIMENASGTLSTLSEADEEIGSLQQMTVEIREEILDMQQSIEEISGIVSVIKNFSNQTNLLALNASIEAARAGDAGRGFAVVADEVAKLAEQTNSATAQINEQVSDITQRFQAFVSTSGKLESVVSTGIGKIGDAKKSMSTVKSTLDELEENITDSNKSINENLTQTEDMKKRVQEINNYATSIFDSTSHVEASIDEYKKALPTLESDLKKMSGMVMETMFNSGNSDD